LSLFQQRYVFQGRLVLETALHLGGGKLAPVSTDAPIVRTPEGDPFIPGSSVKGAFRSAVERIAGVLPGVKTCSLDPYNEHGCIGPQGKAQKAFNQERQRNNWTQGEYLIQLDQRLCDTCKLFGSQYMASRVFFDDLYLLDQEEAYTQVRDGVGIDRDSERAVDQVKFDYEVVASGAEFEMKIVLDNPTEKDLALVSLGLMEFMNGSIRLGGKKSSGLGSCCLENLDIRFLDLRDLEVDALSEKLKSYLLGSNSEEKMEHVDNTVQFLKDKIEFLFREGSKDAEKTG